MTTLVAANRDVHFRTRGADDLMARQMRSVT